MYNVNILPKSDDYDVRRISFDLSIQSRRNSSTISYYHFYVRVNRPFLNIRNQQRDEKFYRSSQFSIIHIFFYHALQLSFVITADTDVMI